MAITLRADNRTIIKDAKYSYLLDNCSSGDTSISVANTEGFFHNSDILIGNIGSENSEILKLRKVDTVNKVLTFKNFSDIAVGGGLQDIAVNGQGLGYEIGQILSVVQEGATGGKVRVSNVDVDGRILTLFIDQTETGYGYTPGVGVQLAGGGNEAASIDIINITPESNDTVIRFETGRKFIAGQPVEVYSRETGESRGRGVVVNSSQDAEQLMQLEGDGIVGIEPGDLVIVEDILKFSHSESTRVTVVQYNKVRFFRTEMPTVPNATEKTVIKKKQNTFVTQFITETISAPHTTVYTREDDPSFERRMDYTPPIVFEGAQPLTEPRDIEVSDFFTTFLDKKNPTGYGWFAFYNDTTLTYSPISNPIPYTGFPENTVKKVFETFDSSMNTKELQLVSLTDRYNWLNEGLSFITNELNLGNWEYFSSGEEKLQIVSGVRSYLLPEDFSDVIYINDSKGNKIEKHDVSHPRSFGGTMQYSIRGRHLEFYPAPSEDMHIVFAYLKSSPTLKNLSDVVDLPNNSFYSIKDYMRFRAYQKLGNESEAANSYALFMKQVEAMKVHASKRDKALDSFTPGRYSCV